MGLGSHYQVGLPAPRGCKFGPRRVSDYRFSKNVPLITNTAEATPWLPTARKVYAANETRSSRSALGRESLLVQKVDHLAEPAQLFLVEVKLQSRQVQQMLVLRLGRQGLGLLKAAALQQAGVILVKPCQRRRA